MDTIALSGEITSITDALKQGSPEYTSTRGAWQHAWEAGEV